MDRMRRRRRLRASIHVVVAVLVVDERFVLDQLHSVSSGYSVAVLVRSRLVLHEQLQHQLVKLKVPGLVGISVSQIRFLSMVIMAKKNWRKSAKMDCFFIATHRHLPKWATGPSPDACKLRNGCYMPVITLRLPFPPVWHGK